MDSVASHHATRYFKEATDAMFCNSFSLNLYSFSCRDNILIATLTKIMGLFMTIVHCARLST